MSIKALQGYTIYSKYSKYLPDQHRRERWDEQVDRVFSMHESKFREYIDNNKEFKDLFEFAKLQVKKKRVLGSQRSLQFGGPPITKHNMKMFNCVVSYCDRPKFFQECMHLLLCGCGTGFSVQKTHIKELPNISNRGIKTKTFVIPDSIEGWADAIGIIMASYFDDSMFPEYKGYYVKFDGSKVRPEGSLISGGFKAPGPKGLLKSLGKISEVIEARLNSEDFKTDEFAGKLRPIDCYDIIMHTSDAVLSGGVRRSATICVFSPEDIEMASAKTGDWFIKNPQRGRSNNSALLVRDKTTKEQFHTLMSSVKEFGEPGFVWAEDEGVLYNPCITGDTWVTLREGPLQVKDIIERTTNLPDKTLEILVNGKFKKTTTKGFWKTGNKQTYQMKLKNGMSIKATDNHQFISNGEWKELKDINIGSNISISNNTEDDIKWNGTGGSTELGWLIGNLIGDGTFSNDECKWSYWGNHKLSMYKQCKLYLGNVLGKEYEEKIPAIHSDHNNVHVYSTLFKTYTDEYNVVKGNKHFNNTIEYTSSDFYKGVIGGMFDADGSIWGNNKQGIYASISQSHEESVNIIQRMLSRLGIVSNIYKSNDGGMVLMPDGKGGEKYYDCKPNFELRICGRYMVERFFNTIHITDPEKLSKFNNIISEYTKEPYISNTMYESEIISITKMIEEDVYDCTVPETSCFDANGIVTHNCVEIGFFPIIEAKDLTPSNIEDLKASGEYIEGKKTYSGWQSCNLCEINVKAIKTEEDFYQACRAAAVIGTLQADYTECEYLGKVSEIIMRKEALLGVSMTGMMDTPEIAFKESVQRKGAKEVLRINEVVASIIGINKAARATCVKPAGTTSCVLGTSSGIHPHHSRRYMRRVQANKLEWPVQYFQKINPKAVEESVWSSNKTDQVITFLCEVPSGAIIKNQVKAIDLLEHVKLTQSNWVEAGTRPECCTRDFVRHNVSNTITVQPDEWEDIENFIYKNRQWFAGISLLPSSGDKDYPQAPFTTVYTPAEIVKEYGDGALMASGLIVDGLKAFEDNLWDACDTVLGLGKKITPLSEEHAEVLKQSKGIITDIKTLKRDWIRRVHKFADNYVNGDLKRTTYLLKDVYNWKLWCDLNREYVDINWDEVVESDEFYIDVTSTTAAACAGGKCEL